ncbi:MAG: sensor histidine kinase [Candidatus Nitrospinota bacterium M3_3B_026]
MPLAREVKLNIMLIWLWVILALVIVAMIGVNLNRAAVAESERAFNRNLEFLADSSAKSVQLFLEGIISRIIPLTQIDVVKRYQLDEVELAFGGVISELDERVSHMILLGDSGEVKVAVTKGPDHFKMLPQIKEFFEETMAGWHARISSRPFSAGDYKGIAVGMPIFRKAPSKEDAGGGSYIYKSGMIMALIDVEDLVNNLIAPVRVGDAGFAWLYTPGGAILGDGGVIESFSKRLYGATGGPERLHEDFGRTLEGGDVLGWRRGEGGGDADISLAIGKNKWSVATARIDALGQTWALAVAAPQTEATRLLNRSFNQSIILFSVMVAVLVVGGSLVTRAHRQWARAEEKAKYASELEKKNRALQELNRRMDEFVAVVSHDIRSPLNVIRGFVKMIRSVPEGERFERETGVMLRSCNRLMQLVNDILDVSKLEAGRVSLAYDPLVIDDLIMESVKTMELSAKEKGQEISLNIGGKTQMEGDGAKLLQVMNNLLGNAIKFTPKGGRIGVTKREEDGRVVIMVTDTGPGIPEEEQDFVFDKFEQAKRSQQGIEPGSGLGLTICKSLVEMHGGSIGVSSRPGRGSTFHVSLPLRRPERGNGAGARMER